MISWLLPSFPRPLRLTLHYVSRPSSIIRPYILLPVCMYQIALVVMLYLHQSVSPAISYQAVACVGRGWYNSHYTFSRENMSWRHPTSTPPHHQTLQTPFHQKNVSIVLLNYMEQEVATDNMHEGCFVYIYLSQSSLNSLGGGFDW